MSRQLSAKVLFRCFLRSYCINAAYNPQGLQNIGLCYALEPALAAIYGPGHRLAEARMRYVAHYNCHPFMTPMLLGALVHMEVQIASGYTNVMTLESVRETVANTLSGIGDSFFNGSLLITWAISCGIFVLAGIPVAAVVLTAIAFVALQFVKLAGFVLGLRKGLGILFDLKRLDLINQGDLLKSINAVLLAVFLWLALPGAPRFMWLSTVLYLLIFGWIVGKWHVPRIYMALLLLGTMITLHVTGLLNAIPALWFDIDG